MPQKCYPIKLTEYEYDVLQNNSMIFTFFEPLLKTATKTKDGLKLSLTLVQLTELIGFVAAEANHARGKRKSEDLNSLCDYLEGLEGDIKRTENSA